MGARTFFITSLTALISPLPTQFVVTPTGDESRNIAVVSAALEVPGAEYGTKAPTVAFAKSREDP